MVHTYKRRGRGFFATLGKTDINIFTYANLYSPNTINIHDPFSFYFLTAALKYKSKKDLFPLLWLALRGLIQPPYMLPY